MDIESKAVKYDKRNLESYSQESLIYDQKRFTGVSGEFLVEILNFELNKFIDSEFVLDVATGTGRIPLSFAGRCKHIIGLDLTPAMIEKAKQKAKEKKLKNVDFIVGNGRKLPFKTETFSTITCIRFFHLIPFEVQNLFLDEFHRCVKPGGKIVVEYNNPFSNFGLEFMRSYKWRRNIRNSLLPWRIRELSRKYNISKIVGVMLPFHLRIRNRFPRFYNLYTCLLYTSPSPRD